MTRVGTKDWTFAAVGDVFVNRPDPANAFEHCAPVLRRFDLVFGNLEGAYTDTPHFAPSAGWRVVAPRHNGSGLREAGFHVLACANNHSVDAGHEGLLDTLDMLQSQGIATVGAGRNAQEAYAPVLLDVEGVRVGVVAFASVYPPGYEARERAPGIAALRIHSHYYIPEWDAYGRVEPGVVPQVRTFPWPEDVDRLTRSITHLRERADVVVVSHHWGQAGRPAVLTEYERILARASIDAGADVVIGHHHHFLRGIEVYKGRPIYYGLGHFVFDLPGLDTALTAPELEKLRRMGEYAIYPRAGYPLSPFHEDARMTMIAVCRFRGSHMQSMGFVPCLIDEQNHAMPLDASRGEGARVASYVKQISQEVGLTTKYIEQEYGIGLGVVAAVEADT